MDHDDLAEMIVTVVPRAQGADLGRDQGLDAIEDFAAPLEDRIDVLAHGCVDPGTGAAQQGEGIPRLFRGLARPLVQVGGTGRLRGKGRIVRIQGEGPVQGRRPLAQPGDRRQEQSVRIARLLLVGVPAG